MKFVFAITFLFAVICLASSEISYKDCGSKVGKITKVDVPGCDASPCSLQKGKNYTVSVTFTTSEATDVAYAIVHGILDGQEVPYPIENPDGCKSSGLTCPLKMGTTYTYTSTLPVLKLYPDIKVVVKWELADAKSGGNDIFCFETLIEVVG